MLNRPSIAGVILTLNEEQYIARALSSLSWCDQVIVLDSGSTDATCEVARLNGASVYKHIQEPPFLITEQRNWALENCLITSEWVLFLDADEEVGSELKSTIIAELSSNSLYNSYELAPRFLFMGCWLKRTQSYPCWHPRLLKRGHTYFTGGVWESFPPSATVGRIPQPYEHYAFSKGFVDWLQRHIRYASWESSSTLDYLQSPDNNKLLLTRSSSSRRIAFHLWPLRPFLRLVQKYILQFGFMDGWQAALYCLLMFIYDSMTVIMIIEKRRLQKNLPL
jgi:glycosyltransferase involved in cell wall biosynthesis